MTMHGHRHTPLTLTDITTDPNHFPRCRSRFAYLPTLDATGRLLPVPNQLFIASS